MHELCTNASLNRLCLRRCQKSRGTPCPHFVGSTVQLLQGFAFHLQLHLRIFLEDLRAALAEQLHCPLVGYASGAAGSGRFTGVCRSRLRDVEAQSLGVSARAWRVGALVRLRSVRSSDLGRFSPPCPVVAEICESACQQTYACRGRPQSQTFCASHGFGQIAESVVAAPEHPRT